MISKSKLWLCKSDRTRNVEVATVGRYKFIQDGIAVKLLFMGRDYPLGYEFFRLRCRNAFLKNSRETDPEKIDRMIKHGEFVVKELEALYMLKKYRALKSRYYSEESGRFDDMLRKINESAS